jgi:hypothetical protein
MVEVYKVLLLDVKTVTEEVAIVVKVVPLYLDILK